MSIVQLAVLGGIWLSLLYSAAVVPATVWSIQIAVSRGWPTAGAAASGLAMGQFPWCLLAALVLFQFPQLWQPADPALRIAGAAFLIWMAWRCLRAPEVRGLRIETEAEAGDLFRSSLWRSLTMPWRLPLWAAFIVSIGVHLRGPGWEAAAWFAIGAIVGQLLWHGHFIIIAALFGNRVPEEISLRSLNKLRMLATAVNAGLAIILLAPLAFPPI